jgi:hypothetical protein
MKDVNKPLREALFPALQATGEHVYYLQAPDEVTGNYIVFNSLSGSPVQQKTGSAVTVNVQITIFSEGGKYNSGEAVDTIAAKIYENVYPDPSFKLPMQTGFTMTSIDLVSDNVNSWRLKHQLVAIDRTITFQFRISIQ